MLQKLKIFFFILIGFTVITGSRIIQSNYQPEVHSKPCIQGVSLPYTSSNLLFSESFDEDLTDYYIEDDESKDDDWAEQITNNSFSNTLKLKYSNHHFQVNLLNSSLQKLYILYSRLKLYC